MRQTENLHVDSEESSDPATSEDPWSPPQFGLKTLFVVITASAVVFSIMHYTGPGLLLRAAWWLGVCWFFILCIQLVRLAK